MQVDIQERNGNKIAVIHSPELVITDTGSALDLLATIGHVYGCSRMVLAKDAITEDFFRLKTCLAGEVLQKFINYHAKLAIVGDFGGYTSSSLQDFIRESNRGRDIFFLATEEVAVEKLAAV
jgi:hypothetical protein